MELKVIQFDSGSASGAVDVADAVVGQDYNEALIHQVVTSYLAGGRQGTRAQKNRAAVRGGGAKPWRQKGTGRARSGTIRSPIWVGGGRTFAASPQDFSKKLNKKMLRAGICSILSELVRNDRLIIVDDVTVDAPKTRILAGKLKAIEASNVLLVLGDANENVMLAARNLMNVDVNLASMLNPVALVQHEKVIATRSAIEKIQESFA